MILTSASDSQIYSKAFDYIWARFLEHRAVLVEEERVYEMGKFGQSLQMWSEIMSAIHNAPNTRWVLSEMGVGGCIEEAAEDGSGDCRELHHLLHLHHHFHHHHLSITTIATTLIIIFAITTSSSP